jgi:hypothetical protein
VNALHPGWQDPRLMSQTRVSAIAATVEKASRVLKEIEDVS